jgi:hypothetical protein
MSAIGFQANCLSTAMGILPHTDITGAVETVLSLNIPFWPHLPKISDYEDMYVQALDHFPGVRIDLLERKILFDFGRSYEEVPSYFEEAEDSEIFRLTKTFSLVYHRFLEGNLRGTRGIRGRMISPISMGLRGVDQDQKPMLYHDDVREGL